MELPSPPAVLAAVLEEVAREDTASIPRLAELCSSDPSLSVELLKLANSPAYYRGQHVVSVRRAVRLLGLRSLRNVVLCAAARACVPAEAVGVFDLDRFWEESLRRAVANRLIAQRTGDLGVGPEVAFTLGLLQDIGVLALVRSRPDLAETWMDYADTQPDVRRGHETAIFGLSHDALARDLAKAWSLPEDLATAMEFHHAPDRAPAEHRPLATVASLGELLASVLGAADRKAALTRARQTIVLATGISVDEVDALVRDLGAEVEATAAALGMHVGEQPTLEEILRAANLGLVAMNLSYEELVAKLERTLAEKERLARELERRNRELEQLSVTCPLTGLPNRRGFSGRLSYEVGRTARHGGPLALLYGDIDHFKQVNDTWGHAFGDHVLRAVAATLSGALRDTDMVARVGGEEFAVILPNTGCEGAVVAAEKLLAALRGTAIESPDAQPKVFTMSLGLAWTEGPAASGTNVDAMARRLVKVADKALYRSKAGGRDRLTVVHAPVPWP